MKLRFPIVLILFVLNGAQLHSQNSWNNADLSIYKQGAAEVTIQELISEDNLFIPRAEFKERTRPANKYWLRIDFTQTPPVEVNDSIWFVRFKTLDHASLYYSSGKEIRQIPVGKYDYRSKGEVKGVFTEVALKASSLIQNRYLFINASKFSSFDVPANWESGYVCIYEYPSLKPYKDLTPLFIFLGIAAIIFILTATFFIYFKQAQFLYYALYILLIATYLSAEPFGLIDFLFGKNSLVSLWFLQTVKISFNIVYIWFCLEFINVKTNYKKIYELLTFIVKLELLLIILNTIFLFSRYHELSIYLMHFHHIVMVIMAAAYSVFYVTKNSKDNLSYFLVTGVSFYFLSFICQFYLSPKGTIGQSFQDNNYFLIIGFVLEIIIFSFGLTYKILTDYNEKLRFQKESFDNRTKALRAQINPHFMFNALSSIQHLIINDNKKSALTYLSKFSRLTRTVLESSIEPDIVLAEEIKLLKDYLELESLRFKNSFQYTINVASDLDIQDHEVPLFIVQPFVENAILHGLLPKEEGERILNINFFMVEGFLICEIDDNGVGRDYMAKKDSMVKKRSRGLQVTKERLELFNKVSSAGNITIIDKKDDNGNSVGTKVVLKICIGQT